MVPTVINILILEDDPLISMDIQSVVDGLDGFVAFTASSLNEALKLAVTTPIQIVIADIHIKGESDGIDTVEALQRLGSCQAIFLTSFSDASTLQRASKLNFCGYLLKPFDEKELIASIKLSALKIVESASAINLGNGYVFDKLTNTLFLNDNPIQFSTKEKILFLLLLKSRGKTVSFAALEGLIWDNEIVTDSTRRQLLHRLRLKIPDLSLRVVKYSGYVLD
jgi:DNA-binding response OmpR family regulator